MQRQKWTNYFKVCIMERDDEIWWRGKSDSPNLNIWEDLDVLTKGMYGIRFQISDKMKDLYNGMIDAGYIDRMTKIEHFCVVLGRPLHQSETPYIKIKWKKNQQLFKYFLDHACPLFQCKTICWDRSAIANLLFLNKGEKMNYPKTMNSRLNCDGYDVLCELLTTYNF